MSFQSTQNLNPTYDLLSATELQATDIVTNLFTATNSTITTLTATTANATNGAIGSLATNSLTLTEPIISTNTLQPVAGELGYFNSPLVPGDIVLTSGINATPFTVTNLQQGNYIFTATIAFSSQAGCNITDISVDILAGATGVYALNETLPVTSAGAFLFQRQFSGVFYNNAVQNVTATANVTFDTAGLILTQANSTFFVVRIA